VEGTDKWRRNLGRNETVLGRKDILAENPPHELLVGLEGAFWKPGGETRIFTPDAVARRRFRRYWLMIRPGSGLIRRLMLRSIRAEAERLPD
jgi:hypothetical protein